MNLSLTGSGNSYRAKLLAPFILSPKNQVEKPNPIKVQKPWLVNEVTGQGMHGCFPKL